jgi:UDP-N-acetyl-2-amino-2-deoxyglucuronate dehydrogenase
MIRFGLLGCGRIARRHSDLLGGRHIEGACLVAVCDQIRSRADLIATKFGIPAHDDIDDFLARKDMDAVAVLTPSGMHPAHVIACAKAGKHVVVEKPMALRLQDADDMVRACDQAGVKLFVVKQNRFNVPVVKAREALEAGRFGRLILGTVRVRWCRDQAYYDQDSWRGTWAYDGGVLSNQASHHVDMLEWFFGDVVSVHARAVTALAKIEAEDTAIATLKFRNGALRHHRGNDGGTTHRPRRLAFDPRRKGNGRNRRVRRQPDQALALCRGTPLRRGRGGEILRQPTERLRIRTPGLLSARDRLPGEPAFGAG